MSHQHPGVKKISTLHTVLLLAAGLLGSGCASLPDRLPSTPAIEPKDNWQAPHALQATKAGWISQFNDLH